MTNEKLNGKVEVPNWVMGMTYIFCWAFAILLIVFEITGYLTYRPMLVALAVYLIFWPVFQVSPGEIIKRIFPG